MDAMEVGLIDENYHAPLLRQWASVAERANIAEHWLHESATDYCSETVCEWISALPANMREQKAELILRPKQRTPEDRCSVMAAAILRNYTDAQVMPLRELFDGARREGVPTVTVLLVPDFYRVGTTLVEWQQVFLTSMVSSRHLRGKATVLYVEDIDLMGKAYSEMLYDHVREFYTVEK